MKVAEIGFELDVDKAYEVGIITPVCRRQSYGTKCGGTIDMLNRVCNYCKQPAYVPNSIFVKWKERYGI